MKKFTKFLSFAILFVISLTFAACGNNEHTHSYGAWQKDDNHHWQICSVCEEETEKKNHTYENGACSTCGKAEPVVGSVGLSFEYANYNQNSYKVTGIGECEDSIIVIPAVHQGKPVVEIAAEAFASSIEYNSLTDPITKISIPSSITDIGREAFKYRGSEIEFINPTITEISTRVFSKYMGSNFTIPSSVTTLGDYSFEYTGRLTSITIPNSVTSIGISTFIGAFNLQTVIFEEGSQIQELPQGIFNNCESLTSIEIPASVKRLTTNGDYYVNEWNGTFKNVTGTITFAQGSQLEFIAKNYFQNFKGVIILPEGYTVIDEAALYATSEAKIVLPVTVTEIKKDGLAANEGNINNYPASTIFYMGTNEQWEGITKGSSAVSVSVTIYKQNEWQMISGVPTPNN